MRCDCRSMAKLCPLSLQIELKVRGMKVGQVVDANWLDFAGGRESKQTNAPVTLVEKKVETVQTALYEYYAK